jgi:hypothetical protein
LVDPQKALRQGPVNCLEKISLRHVPERGTG